MEYLVGLRRRSLIMFTRLPIQQRHDSIARLLNIALDDRLSRLELLKLAQNIGEQEGFGFRCRFMCYSRGRCSPHLIRSDLVVEITCALVRGYA